MDAASLSPSPASHSLASSPIVEGFSTWWSANADSKGLRGQRWPWHTREGSIENGGPWEEPRITHVALMATFPAHKGRNIAWKISWLLAVVAATLYLHLWSQKTQLPKRKVDRMARGGWLSGKDINRSRGPGQWSCWLGHPSSPTRRKNISY